VDSLGIRVKLRWQHRDSRVCGRGRPHDSRRGGGATLRHDLRRDDETLRCGVAVRRAFIIFCFGKLPHSHFKDTLCSIF
jgi:hypothetical protein